MNNLRCYYSIGVFYWETSHTRGGRRHEFSDQTARAITIIELTTAMTITVVIAAIAMVAGKRLSLSTGNVRVVADIYQFTQGLEEFSRQLGDYPPDFHDAKSSESISATAFPASPENYPDLSNQSPVLALYFWLAGPRGNGLSANPKNPFDSGSRRASGRSANSSRSNCGEVNGAMHYFPLCNLRGGAGKVHFRGGQNGYDGHPGFPPCASLPPLAGRNVDQFGLLPDHLRRTGRRFWKGYHYPAGYDYDPANLDDITNFSGGPLGQRVWTRQQQHVAERTPTGDRGPVSPRTTDPDPSSRADCQPGPVDSTRGLRPLFCRIGSD